MTAMRSNHKRTILVSFTLLTFSLLLFSSPANAQVPLSFDDGGTVTGFFVYNLVTGAITNWDFTVAGGGTPGFEYTPTTSTVNTPQGGFGNSSFFDFTSNATSVSTFPIGDLQFVTQETLNPTSALDFLLTGTSYDIAN